MHPPSFHMSRHSGMDLKHRNLQSKTYWVTHMHFFVFLYFSPLSCTTVIICVNLMHIWIATNSSRVPGCVWFVAVILPKQSLYLTVWFQIIQKFTLHFSPEDILYMFTNMFLQMFTHIFIHKCVHTSSTVSRSRYSPQNAQDSWQCYGL